MKSGRIQTILISIMLVISCLSLLLGVKEAGWLDGIMTKNSVEISTEEEQETAVGLAAEIGVELVANGGFEDADAAADTFNGWELKNEDDYALVETGMVHSGNAAVSLTSTNEWARQWIDIKPGGGTYEMTGYVYLTEGAELSDARLKIEGYTEKQMSQDTATISSQIVFSKLGTSSDFAIENNELDYGKWLKFTYQFNPTAETEWFVLYVRGLVGTVYFDDITCTMVEAPESSRVDVRTNSNFYYLDTNQGTATLTPNEYLDSSNWTGVCQILQGDEVKWTQEGSVDFSDGAMKEVTFDLTGYEGDYTFELILSDKGEEIDRIQWEFSKRHVRPTVLNEQGLWIEEDGEVFHPVIAYHMYKTPEIKRCAEEFGVNVFQLAHGWVLKYEYAADKDRLIELLDTVRSVNGKVLISLYLNNLICSHEENIELVKKYMHEFLDEDGALHEYEDLIFAWGMDDEPVGGGVSEDYIRAAYEMIREIDPDRPVYSIDQHQHYYPTLIRNADRIVLDNYPYGKRDAMSYIYDCVEYAIEEGSPSGRSFGTLLQCWPRGTGNYMDKVNQKLYCPSGNGVRNMIYQSFMAGAVSLGYYGFDYPDTNDPNEPNMKDTDMAKGIAEFAAKEQDIMFDYFVDKEYPTFNSNVNGLENMRYVSFLKDDKIYMVVLNKKEFEAQTVSVPLKSNNGAVTISSYTAEGYAGGAEDITTAVTTGTLDVTLEPGAAAVYIITPSETISAEALQ